MYLLVGLGNPGPRYAGTRHNVGFAVIERVAERWGIRSDTAQHGALVGSGRIGEQRAVLARPQKFMNLSGTPVAALAAFYKVEADHVVVVHDDVDLVFGSVRVKIGGGHGGHNGLRDVSRHLGADYLRIRCGVGRPPEGWETADYVLARWTDDERAGADDMVERSADAVEALLAEGPLAAMNHINVRADRGRAPASGGQADTPETVAATRRREEQ